MVEQVLIVKYRNGKERKYKIAGDGPAIMEMA